MRQNEAQAIAIAKNVSSRTIRELKRQHTSSPLLGDSEYLAEARRAEAECVAALLEAAGASPDADPRAILDQAWAEAPRDENGDVESSRALQLAAAEALLTQRPII